MPRPRITRKCLEFDLSKDKLAECGFKVNSKSVKEKLEPYTQIRRVMEAQGFEHRQGSVYYSREKLSQEDVHEALKTLAGSLPWFNNCIKKFDTTNVSDTHDIRREFSEIAAEIEKTKSDELLDLDVEKNANLDESFPLDVAAFDDIDLEEQEHDGDDEYDLDEPELDALDEPEIEFE